MRLKGLRFLLSLVLCLAPLSVYVLSQEQALPTLDVNALTKKMVLTGELTADKDMMMSLAKQVIADCEALSYLFGRKDFKCMAKLLGKRGAVLTTPDYQKVCGGESEKFWQSAWKEGVELRFVPASIVLSGAIGLRKVPACILDADGNILKDKDGKIIDSVVYDATAVVILEFHLLSGRGSTFHNDSGMSSESYLHKNGCPWG